MRNGRVSTPHGARQVYAVCMGGRNGPSSVGERHGAWRVCGGDMDATRDSAGKAVVNKPVPLVPVSACKCCDAVSSASSMCNAWSAWWWWSEPSWQCTAMCSISPALCATDTVPAIARDCHRRTSTRKRARKLRCMVGILRRRAIPSGVPGKLVPNRPLALVEYA